MMHQNRTSFLWTQITLTYKQQIKLIHESKYCFYFGIYFYTIIVYIHIFELDFVYSFSFKFFISQFIYIYIYIYL